MLALHLLQDATLGRDDNRHVCPRLHPYVVLKIVLRQALDVCEAKASLRERIPQGWAPGPGKSFQESWVNLWTFCPENTLADHPSMSVAPSPVD
jgi:hypothetical protein